jgi:hypothetical protein
MRLTWTGFCAISAALLAIGACGDDGGNNNGDGDAGNNGGNDGGAVAGEVRVDSLTPDHGPLTGGTVVTVAGAGFVLNMAGDAMILVDGVLAESVTVIDDSTIEVTVPAGVDPGDVDVTVFNANGFITITGAYSYNALPTLTEVNPPMGDLTGGDTVTLTGTGFSNLEPGTNAVMVGGTAGDNVTVNSDTELTVDVPAGEAFSVADITLSNANGDAGPVEYRYHADGLLVSTSGLSINRGRIFYVNPTSGAMRQIADIIVDGERTPVTALELVGTTVYAATGRNFVTTRLLITIDPFTGETTEIGPLFDPNAQNPKGGGGPPGEVICRDFVYINSTMYCNGRDTLFTVNLTDGECTAVGSTGGWRNGRGTGHDGTTMYEVADGSIYTMNPADGATTFLRGITNGNGTINGLAYVGSTWYATEKEGGKKKGGGGNPNGRVLTLDIATGAVTEVVFALETMWDAVVGTPAY